MDDKTRKIVEHLYIDALLNEEPEKVEEPYEVNQQAYDNYEKVLILLAQLKGKGKCDFTYDSVRQPYMLHCINIVWNYDESGYFELSTKELASILEKMDDIVIDKQTENEWQLSITIYTAA